MAANLIDTIKRDTDRPHYAEVAELLNAAGFVPARDKGLGWDQANLKQRIHSTRKRSRKLLEELMKDLISPKK
jgi:hypothetical protein